MKTGLSKRTVMEMALIRSCRAASAVSIDEVLRQLHALKQQLDPHAAASSLEDKKKVVEAVPAPRPAPAAAPAPAPLAPVAPVPSASLPPRPVAPAPPPAPSFRPAPGPAGSPPAAPAGTATPAAPAKPPETPNRSIQAWASDPKVRMVMNAFNGDILDVRV